MMETTLIWVGEHIYGDVGIKWKRCLAIFGHGGERLIVANHETFVVLGFVIKEKEYLWVDGYEHLWTKNELIFELRVENSKIDGDFERISSPLVSRWCFPFIVNLREQLAKAKNVGSN